MLGSCWAICRCHMYVCMVWFWSYRNTNINQIEYKDLLKQSSLNLKPQIWLMHLCLRAHFIWSSFSRCKKNRRNSLQGSFPFCEGGDVAETFWSWEGTKPIRLTGICKLILDLINVRACVIISFRFQWGYCTKCYCENRPRYFELQKECWEQIE